MNTNRLHGWGVWLFALALVLSLASFGMLIYQMRGFALAQDRAAESQIVIEQVTKKLSARQAEVEALSQRYDTLVGQVAGFEKKLELSRQAAEEESRAKANLATILDRTKHAEDDQSASTKRQEQLTVQVTSLQQKQAALQTEIEDLTRRRTTLAPEVAALEAGKQRLTEAQNQLRDVQRQMSQAEEASKLIQQKQVLAVAELDDLKKQADTLRKTVADFQVLQQRSVEEQQKTEAYRATRAQLERQEQALKNDIRLAKTDLDKLTKERESLKEAVTGLTESQKQATEVQQAVAASRARLAELQQQEKDLRSEMQTVQGGLEKLRQADGELRTTIGAQREQVRQLQAEERDQRMKLSQLQPAAQTQPSKK